AGRPTGLLLLCFVRVLALLMAPLQCVLMGFWINNQGSNMTINLVNDKGKFSSLTATRNETKISPLQGSQHPKKKVNQPTFGFTINWSFSDATAVFVGQCFVDTGGKEVLATTWLLREPVGSLEDDWEATR
ncbi:AVID protein, partial [Nothocercus julius]|nr:AVID protein [Nothocercus julius]